MRAADRDGERQRDLKTVMDREMETEIQRLRGMERMMGKVTG